MEKQRTLKILFIDTSYSRDELNESINIDVILGSVKEEIIAQLDITTIYEKLNYYEEVTEDLNQYLDYDAVFISSKISLYDVFQNYLKVYSSLPIFVGGILSTYINRELAEQFKDAILLLGEGETNINEIMEMLLYLKSINSLCVNGIKDFLIKEQVPNICFWDFSNGSVYTSKRIAFDLNKGITPPKHSTINKTISYAGLIRMETSRGCPWNMCSFCVMPWRYCGEKWRAFPNIKIEQELITLINKGVRQILFTDEDFIGNIQHIVDLCEIISKYNSLDNPLVFGGSTSVRTLLSLESNLDRILTIMYNAGIKTLFLGIESGSDSQLQRYNKGVTAAENEIIIKKLSEYPFVLDIGFIMFDAETTMDELRENLTFIKECDLQLNMSRFAKTLRVVPHTSLYAKYKNRGYISSDINFEEMYYEYRFIDPTIHEIVKYLEVLDKKILISTYELQTKIRYEINIDVKHTLEKKLSIIRMKEYRFLSRCVEYYFNNSYLPSYVISSLFQDEVDQCLDI